MRDCPQCGAFVDGEQCQKCRYSEAKRGHTALPDVDKYRCAWTDRGVRCTNAGTWSDSTNGSGPWYCRDCDRRRAGISTRHPPPQGFKAISNLFRELEPVYQREPGEEG